MNLFKDLVTGLAFGVGFMILTPLATRMLTGVITGLTFGVGFMILAPLTTRMLARAGR